MRIYLKMQKSPEVGIDGLLGMVGIGGLLGMGSSSLMSTTTALDVRKVLATDAACSKQHLTTCSSIWQEDNFIS